MKKNLGFLIAAALSVLPLAVAAQDAPQRFQTPSGNIICQVLENEDGTDANLYCDVLEFSNTAPPAPADCEWPEDFGHSFQLGVYEGSAIRICTHDSFNEPGMPVLAYGAAWEYGDYFRCTAERAGLTCQNQFGNGFFLSRNSQEIY